MSNRLFVIIDVVSSSMVKNPAPACQSRTDYVFYQNQAESFLNEHGDREFTIYELNPITTKRAIV